MADTLPKSSLAPYPMTLKSEEKYQESITELSNFVRELLRENYAMRTEIFLLKNKLKEYEITQNHPPPYLAVPRKKIKL